MELVFNAKEVEALLLEKAKAMGIECNTVEIKASYGRLDNATVSFVEPEKAEAEWSRKRLKRNEPDHVPHGLDG